MKRIIRSTIMALAMGATAASTEAQGFEGALLETGYFGWSGIPGSMTSVGGDAVFRFNQNWGVQLGAGADWYQAAFTPRWYEVEAHVFNDFSDMTRGGLFLRSESLPGAAVRFITAGAELELVSGPLEVEGALAATWRSTGGGASPSYRLDAWYDLSDDLALHAGTQGFYNLPGWANVTSFGLEYQASDQVALTGGVGYASSSFGAPANGPVVEFGIRITLGDAPGETRFFEQHDVLPAMISLGF